MTTLTITPKVADKTARFKGTIAAGEHVAVTIKGGAEWIGTDNGANLTLRVLDLVTGRTLAVFPYWTEDNSEDWPEGQESADAWAPATDDSNDLYCELNLNTTRMVDAARHMLRVPVMFVLGDTDYPRTLYFRDRYEVEYWPERIGDTVPYDLDKWPKKIDDWTELVTGWTAKLNGMKLTAVPFTGKVVSGVSKNGVTITLNDGDDTADTVVDLFDGEVSVAQMNTAISAMGSTKQNTLTFDDIPTAESDNPVKSGGVKAAIDEVADDVADHVGNTGIHVTAEQKTAWTAKYDKPNGGIPKSDLAQAVKDSLGKADTAVQTHQSLDAYVNAAGYDSTAKEIQLKHDSTVVARIDATAFIKDGMVDGVEVSGGNLVISFNTDAGVEDIEIPLTNIFNPANYYDKTAADGRFVQKEAGKGLVAVDATLATQGAAADAKAVGDALRGGFTDWEFSGVPDGHVVEIKKEFGFPSLNFRVDGSVVYDSTESPAFVPSNRYDEATSATLTGLLLDGQRYNITATRHLITPTKTSQLENDGAPNGGGTPYATTEQIPDVTGKADKAANATAGNLASLDSSGNLSDSGVKPSDFATPSDLPYRLVEPGKWEYASNVELTNFSVNELVYEDEFDTGEFKWVLRFYSDETGNEEQYSYEPQDALVLDFGGITATRASLPGHLCDRAGNRVVVTGDTTLTLPAAVPGYIRDFLVRLTVSASSAITFSAQTGETITWDAMGDPSATFAAGTYLYRFTEVAPGVFHAEDMMALVGLEAALAAINGGVAS